MIQNTPIQEYKIGRSKVFVKREDLACLPPGPPFAKVRGLYPTLQKLKKEGITIVSYIETSISMAGWGVSYFCKKMGLKAVIFYPKYKNGERDNQLFQFEKWKEFDAEVIPLEKPNRLMINWYRARKLLKNKYPDAIMLPQGLPFEETVQNVAEEVIRDYKIFQNIKTIIICAGSGVMCAGVLKGIMLINELYSIRLTPNIFGILISPKSPEIMKKKIFKMAKVFETGFFSFPGKVKIFDIGYQYTDIENCACPFPCNIYYDRKAWKWMRDNILSFEQPLLFWNIGE